MNKTLAETTARASRFPWRLVNPQLESRAMKNKQTERKLRPSIRLTRHFIGRVLCLAAISLICSSASAENLFAVDAVQGNYGNIDEFTPNGVRSVFASGLTSPFAMAFDSGGNLFVADGGDPWAYPPVAGGVYKFTPTGLRSTIVSDMGGGLAIDSADNLFVGLAGSILKISPSGVRTTFASRSVGAMAFQRNLAPTATTLGNISTRAFVQTGEDVMIGGFIVQGTGTKSVIIRAIGPELGLPPYNIPNALANPTLELHNAAGELLGSNDNWQTTIIGGIITSNQVSDIQNSGHAPTEASESAIIANLAPGNYTAIVRGVSNTTGVALVEVYDLNP